ncbi:Long-chain-fatty-acid-coa ligase [Globisporangium polare]
MPTMPTMQLPAFLKNRLRVNSQQQQAQPSTSTSTSNSMGAALSAEDAATQHSREVPESATATRGPIRVVDIEADYEPSMTLWTNLLDRKKLDDGSKNLFGTRKVDPVTGQAGAFEWVTYGEFLADVEATSSGMSRDLGLQRNAIVGVFCKNRYEWSVVENSCNRMTYTLVPLYDTLGPTAVPFIINHTEMKVVFCAKAQFQTLMACAHNCPTLETIVQFEDVDDDERALAKEKNVVLKTLAEVMAVGKASSVPEDPPQPEDISTICYTSGTTGDPKGAILTHANLAFTTGSVRKYTELLASDVHLSYLPLAHVFERCVHTNLISSGGAIGFYQGDVAKLMEDIAALKPTLFPSVPRVLNRIFDKITQGVNGAGGAKKFVFDQAFAAKRVSVERSGLLTHALWDPVVFNKVKMVLGGNVRLMMNGSAPLSPEVKEFIQVVFGCPVLEGYGLTETSAVVAVSNPSVPSGDHVGIPLPGLEVRLEDVPDMNYTSKDEPLPRGEVLVRGRNVFRGYFKQPELTAEVLDADGWFHTGDVGCWNANGTLRIIDRKKNIFKLAQGEYVAPEKIEGVYLKSSFVAQLYVHGDSLQSYLVAVVVPDHEVIAKWAAEQGVTGPEADVETLIQNSDERLKQAVLQDMEALALELKLFRFERVQKLHLHATAFAPEDDLLTPTFKPKRSNLARFFEKEIAEMYAGAPAF